jgi:prepilin-type N-terminal cleavage/methylation domain-containing protein
VIGGATIASMKLAISPAGRTLLSATGRRPVARSRAFTLPEVLAALVLIGIVLPPVLKGVSLAMGACDDAKRKIEATGLAESKLAELTIDAVQLVSSGGGSGTFPEHPDYAWDAQTVTQDTDLSEITVRVTWTARGTQRTIDLSTLVFTGTSGSSASTDASATGGGT